MSSGAMPNRPAMRACAIAMPWLGVSMDRLPPSQDATMAWGSIALWYCVGVSYTASIVDAAAASLRSIRMDTVQRVNKVFDKAEKSRTKLPNFPN